MAIAIAHLHTQLYSARDLSSEHWLQAPSRIGIQVDVVENVVSY